MKRTLAHPLLIITLTLLWLALQQSLSFGSLLMGLLVALIITRLWVQLRPAPVRIRSFWTLICLFFRVNWDIVASNFKVARLIVMKKPYAPTFVHIPLQLTDPTGLATLACIITATPGTIWISHDSAEQMLTIHVLDLKDKQELISHIKAYYEQPLRRIFQPC